MSNQTKPSHGDRPHLLKALAEFRSHLRTFLHFSEHAATEAGLHPQQHQLLLQIAAAPEATPTTIAYAAERLGLRHNSVVELVDRSVAEGLLRRTEDAEDRRRVLLVITRKGRLILDSLSDHHAHELRELGPQLIRALQRIERLNKPQASSMSSIEASPLAQRPKTTAVAPGRKRQRSGDVDDE